MVIITGMHRSGTTFLGKILEKTKQYDCIYEPLNKDRGIVDVDTWYKYYPMNLASTDESILEKLYTVNLKYKRYENNNDDKSMLERILRKLVFSRGHLDYIIHKVKPNKKEVLYKDPFFTLAAGRFSERFQGVKTIYVVRHPIAIYNSLKRMDWKFDLNEILKQPLLVKDHCQDFCDKFSSVDTLHEQSAYLWKLLYRVVYEQHHAASERSIIIRHEDLSQNPYETYALIHTFLGLKTDDSKVDSFIKSTMFSDKVNAKDDQVHDFKRNSYELAYSWKNKMNPEYLKILDIVGEDLHRYYND